MEPTPQYYHKTLSQTLSQKLNFDLQQGLHGRACQRLRLRGRGCQRLRPRRQNDKQRLLGKSGHYPILRALALSKSGKYRKTRALARSKSGNYCKTRALARAYSGNYHKTRGVEGTTRHFKVRGGQVATPSRARKFLYRYIVSPPYSFSFSVPFG